MIKCTNHIDSESRKKREFKRAKIMSKLFNLRIVSIYIDTIVFQTNGQTSDHNRSFVNYRKMFFLNANV